MGFFVRLMLTADHLKMSDLSSRTKKAKVNRNHVKNKKRMTLGGGLTTNQTETLPHAAPEYFQATVNSNLTLLLT